MTLSPMAKVDHVQRAEAHALLRKPVEALDEEGAEEDGQRPGLHEVRPDLPEHHVGSLWSVFRERNEFLRDLCFKSGHQGKLLTTACIPPYTV